MQHRSPVNIDTVEYAVTGQYFDPSRIRAKLVKGSNMQTGELDFEATNRFRLRGKAGSHLVVRTQQFHKELVVSGSLGKYLFGQNLLTSANMDDLCLHTLKAVLGHMGIRRSPAVKRACDHGDIELHEVHLAVNFSLDSEEQVFAIIRQLRLQLIDRGCYSKGRKTGVELYPDSGSGFSIHAYAKGQEMRRSAHVQRLNNRAQAEAETRSILRVELKLRADLVRLGLNKLSTWSSDRAEEVFWEYLKRLKLEEVTTGPLNFKELAQLPQELASMYAHYKTGMSVDVLRRLYAPATYQRYRSRLAQLGINIDLPNLVDSNYGLAHEAINEKTAIREVPEWLHVAGIAPFELPRLCEPRPVRPRG